MLFWDLYSKQRFFGAIRPQFLNEMRLERIFINYLCSWCSRCLQSFAPVRIHPSVDIYAIFRFKPMHVFHIVTSRLLKEHFVGMVNDNDKTVVALKSRPDEPKTYKQIWERVLHELDYFLKKLNKNCQDFSCSYISPKEKILNNLPGLFGKDGCIGMLADFDFEKPDQVPSFLRANVDIFCEINVTVGLISVFTKYCVWLLTLNWKQLDPGWIENELGELRNNIVAFKKKKALPFGRYQASLMDT